MTRVRDIKKGLVRDDAFVKISTSLIYLLITSLRHSFTSTRHPLLKGTQKNVSYLATNGLDSQIEGRYPLCRLSSISTSNE